jgi:hypothetical protein
MEKSSSKGRSTRINDEELSLAQAGANRAGIIGPPRLGGKNRRADQSTGISNEEMQLE